MNDERVSHFELLGGEAGVRQLVDRFYDRMDSAPQAVGIRALHPPDLTTSREKLFLFLVGWSGGPQLYVERYGHPMLRARHLPFSIGDAESKAWVWCMDGALDEHEMPADLRQYLKDRFRSVAAHMHNRVDDPPETS